MDQNTTFSSVRDSIRNVQVKQLDDLCDKHEIPLVVFKDRKMCPSCAKELTEQREQELITQITDQHYANEEKRAKFNQPENYIKKSLLSDKKIRKASFSTYEVTDEETKVNKKKARLIAKRYIDGEVFNTILSGKVGTGKSHLAYSILKAVNEHIDPKQRCLYVSAYKLLNTLRASYQAEQSAEDVREKLVKLCKEAYLLVIDDLGAEVGSKNNNKVAASDNFSLLNDILENRLDLPTIFTTNLTSDQIESTYDDRIRSRVLSEADKSSVITFKETKDKRNRIEF